MNGIFFPESKSGFYLHLFECFYNVAFFKIVAVGKTDTALEVSTNFLDIILETLQSCDVGGLNDYTVANEYRLVAARNIALDDKSTGNETDFAYGENLTNVNSGSNVILERKL